VRWANEGFCPLCEMALTVHHRRACCPCCGDSYLVGTGRMDIKRCPVHGKHCTNWQAVWNSRSGS